MKPTNHRFMTMILAGLLNAGVAGQALAATDSVEAHDGNGYGSKAGKYVDDAWITAKVKTMLLRDEGVKGLDINVATHMGTVQLAGWVDDSMQVAQAENIARSVEGVTGVRNDLQFKH